MKHKFELPSENDLIVVTTYIRLMGKKHYYPLSLILDTGASHTVIDMNLLLVAGYDMSLRLNRNVKVQTANKIIDADKFLLDELKVGDRALKRFEVTTYDFLAQEDLLNYDGVLGLDFFKNTQLHIDFKNLEFIIHQ